MLPYLKGFNLRVEKPLHISRMGEVREMVEKYLSDPNIGLAEKQDGHRVILAGDGQGDQWLINKQGEIDVISSVNDTPLQMKCAESLRWFGCSYVLDGEAIGGRNNWSHYIIFNILMLNGHDWQNVTQAEREEALAVLASAKNYPYVLRPTLDNTDHPIQVLATTTDEAEKRELYQNVLDSVPVSEGVIFRDMSAPIVDGYNTNVLKYPLLHEIDVVAYKWHEPTTQGPGKGGSVSIAVYHNGERCHVGGLRSGLTYELLDYCKGELEAERPIVMKAQFLGKRTITKSLVQPRLVEIRHDKKPEDCLSSQYEVLWGGDWPSKF